MFPLVGYMLLFVAIGVGFILVHLVIGKLVRPDRPHQEKDTIYECGEPTIGSAWVQFDLRFYVIALLFVIFDVEVAFFFPWAVVFGQANTVTNSPEESERFRQAAYVLAPTQAHMRDKQSRELRQLAEDKRELEAIEYKLKNKKDLSRPQENQLYKLASMAARLHGLTLPPRVSMEEARTRRQDDSQLAKELEIVQKNIADTEEQIQETKKALDTLDSNVVNDAAANRAAARSLAWFALWDILVFFGVLLVGFAYLWKRGDLHWVKALTSDTAKPLARVQQSAAQTVGTGS